MSDTALATRARIAQLAKARAERVEDIEFMIASGVSNEVEVARRLGTTVITLERWCYRTGNADLWHRLIAYRLHTRDDWLGDRALLRPRKEPAA